MGQIWNQFIFQPMLNGLLWLYSVLGNNFGLAIVAFTVLVRLVTLPFSIQQLRSAKSTQELQPLLEELQKKYKGDKEKLGEEQVKLYKEHGINPLGCLVPTLIQFPIWIGLYQSIINAIPQGPSQLINLAKHIYAANSHLVPLNAQFLWLNLGRPDPYFVLPVLVVATQWILQKMMTPPASTREQAAQNQSMELMMPLMFGMISFSLASGLGLYFVVTNLVGAVQQFFFTGWGSLLPRTKTAPASEKTKHKAIEKPAAESAEEPKEKGDGRKKR